MQINVTTSYPPAGLSLSGIACWWSMMNLIAQQPFGPVHFWTVTAPDVIPYWSFGIRHANFLARLQSLIKQQRIKPVAGVRVFEPHPSEHGLHSHLLISGRLPIRVCLDVGKQCGLGRMSVSKTPVGPGMANYMSKYLVKSRNMPMPGVRRWANIFKWDGCHTRDIEVRSKSIDVFRSAYREAKALGRTKSQAYNYAVVTQHAYDTQDV